METYPCCIQKDYKMTKIQKFTLENFLEIANKKFDNKFDYSLVEFRVKSDKIKIICPEHGEITQSVTQHLLYKYGCGKCSNKYKNKLQKMFSYDENFIGQKFEKGTVKSFYGYNNRKVRSEQIYEVLCECGNIYYATKSQLTHCLKKDCGKHQKENRINNMGANYDIFHKFGMLSLLDDPKSNYYTKCICDCGEQVYLLSKDIECGKKENCGCSKKFRGKDNKLYKGYEDISSTFWTRVKHNATNRNIDFTISIEYIWNLFIEQDKKCVLSGLPLCICRSKGNHSTASLDRIDSNVGYIPGNVQWVHKSVNKIKSDFVEERFIELCCKICDFTRNKENLEIISSVV